MGSEVSLLLAGCAARHWPVLRQQPTSILVNVGKRYADGPAAVFSRVL